MGLRWFQDRSRTPSGSSPCAGTGAGLPAGGPAHRPGPRTSLAYRPLADVVLAEFHSHGSARAFFSPTDDRDEQGFRIYGVVGRLDTPSARAASPGRRLRPLRPGGLAAGVLRPDRSVRQLVEDARSDSKHLPNDKEVN